MVDDEDNTAAYEFDNYVGEGDGELDASAAGYSFVMRTMHFLRGERITNETRPVVELACLMEAGIFITGLGVMKNEAKWPRMREKYVRCLSEFGVSDFQSLDVRDKMMRQMYRAQGILDGKRLWDKYGDIRSELRTMSAELPSNLASMPSDNQLHDAYTKFLVARYRKINVSCNHVCL